MLAWDCTPFNVYESATHTDWARSGRTLCCTAQSAYIGQACDRDKAKRN